MGGYNGEGSVVATGMANESGGQDGRLNWKEGRVRVQSSGEKQGERYITSPVAVA